MTPRQIVVRLRAHAHVAHAAATWGFAEEGFVMEKAADLIEKEIINGNEEEGSADGLRGVGKAPTPVGKTQVLEEREKGGEE